MRIVSLVTDRVKFFAGNNHLLLLAAIVACLAALTIGIPRYVLERSSAHGVNPTGSKPQGCCGNVPASLRRMIGTYYTTEDGFKSTLILNNKGPHQIVVTPVLHGRNGESYKAPPVSVGGESSYEVDLNTIAESAGSKFRSGGIEFTYTGRMMEMGGGLRIVNAEKSLIFDEQFLEPGMKFSSSQLEAVYAMPFEDARVSVIVTNTTEKPLSVTGNAVFAGDRNQRPIQGQLKPYETEVISLPHGQTKEAGAGAVSLSHNGGEGALMAMIHVQNADRGYSESVNFHDPTQGKTNQWHGAGLRLGSVNNDALRPVIAVRNLGKDATAVAASVPFSLQNGKTGKIALPPLPLAPGEIKVFDASNPQLRLNEIATAGLEIEYKGAPGSVIVSASSVSQSGNQVFALPLKDPQGGMSSTGGYPWFINGNASTIVHIKNVTDQPRKLHLDVVFTGGRWGSGLRTVEPHQTVSFDVRQIRDSQKKGYGGGVIPTNATSGHISWSYLGGQNKAIIGRAQTVDQQGGIVSTYECQCTCGYTYARARMTPGTITGFVGDSSFLQVEQQDENCYGITTSWYPTSHYVSFSSQSSSVATISSSGTSLATASAVGVGQTNLLGNFTAIRHVWQGFGCVDEEMPAFCSAVCTVQGCGDERDQILQEYIVYSTAAVPRCLMFTYMLGGGNASEHFTYAELNRTNDYSWAVVGDALLTLLERTRATNGNVPLRVNSAYRNPARNCGYNVSCSGLARDSQHIYGYGADLRTVSN